MHAKKNINGSLISLLILISIIVHQIMVILRKAIIFADQLMLLNLVLYVWQTGRSNVDVIALNCDQLVNRQQHSWHDVEISFSIVQHKSESLSFGLLLAAFQTVRK
jgi:hypothetical protein